MQIISPVDNLAEAKGLLEAGADELYGGYVPESWSRYRLLASLNQRTFATAQISSRDEIAEIIQLAQNKLIFGVRYRILHDLIRIHLV